MFGLRLAGFAELAHQFAMLQFLAFFPMVYMLVTSKRLGRTTLYVIQVSLLLAFLLVELIVDTILRVDFRHTHWMVITYVTFFFAATGGLLGLITLMESRGWTITGVALFLVMAILAFVSRTVTGI
jgi:hypothetical protein